MNSTKMTVTHLLKRLVIVQIVSFVLGMGAGTLAIIGLTNHVNDIQTSRTEARYDNCQLLRGIILTTIPAGNSVASTKALAFINSTPLHDCVSYSRQGP